MKVLVSKGEDRVMVIKRPLTEKDISERKIIKKYKKIFRQKNLPVTHTAMCWGLEIGFGWHWLVDSLCEEIQRYIDYKKVEQVEAVQVKEKFGGLRFYVDGADDYIHNIITFAENLSFKICENCGTTENVSQNRKGWITTLCDKCRNKRYETLKKELHDIDLKKGKNK